MAVAYGNNAAVRSTPALERHHMEEKEILAIKDENSRLKKELERYHAGTTLGKGVLKRALSFMVGKGLHSQVGVIIGKIKRSEQVVITDWIQLGEAILLRVFRVSLFAVLAAILPSILLIWQNMILREQNSYLKESNKFNIYTHTNKTPLLNITMKGWTCEGINSGPHPLYNVSIYRGYLYFRHNQPENAIPGNPGVSFAPPVKLIGVLEPGEPFEASLLDETQNKICAGLLPNAEFADCLTDHTCSMVVGCLVRFQRSGDRKTFIARQFSIAENTKGACVLSELNERFTSNAGYKKVALELARKLIGTQRYMSGVSHHQYTEIVELE